MTPTGPYPPGDGRDDWWGDGDARGPDVPGEDGGPQPGGWVPPEDRPWRHPSELSSSTSTTGPANVGGGRPPSATTGSGPGHGSSGTIHAVSGRRRTAALALVGSGAAAAVFAGIVLLNTMGSRDGARPATRVPPTTTAALTTSPAAAMPSVAQQARQSMVSLTVETSHGAEQGCGVAVPGTGMVATTAAAVVGSTTVMATTATGKDSRAEVVAVDDTADVALLRVDDVLPVPRFADDGSLDVGQPVTVMAMVTERDGAGPDLAWSDAVVRSVGTTVGKSKGTALAGIEVSGSDLATMPGELLLDRSGAVIGILGTPAGSGPAGAAGGFVPARLLLGVTSDLAQWGAVRHGWLDVTGRDSGSTTGRAPAGVVVVGVSPDGPSAGRLRAGDVIDEVAGGPVRSMAELRQRLYVLPAGTEVAVGVRRGTASFTTDIELAASP